MSQYWLGVDGGGTSCRARLVDEQGNVLGNGKAGSANVMLGVENALAAVIEAAELACQEAGLSTDVLHQTHAGLALAGAEQSEYAKAFLQLSHPFASITLDTDAFGAVLGAFDGQDGAIMIFGTGSCGLLWQNEQVTTVGGHEFPISDHGGGATLGLEVVRHTLLAAEDIIPASQLSEQVMAHFDHDIEAVVRFSKTARPTDYGQFARPCFDLADAGDPLAKTLIERHLADCEMLLNALIRRGATQIALMGSIGQRVASMLPASLQPYFVQPKFDAQHGGILMAKRAQGLSIG
ncbi:BadF/BadG/BcrA/BcrD ATPase family protein [Salinibius halmophilus]|uniref:BadF/BadG/BcrA/BcrD ATPase family protein n=1 Tax=Salinibius halmophilus TaxID=1853216 RepID=UPI000E661C64|nr:BadF/BadG/BcrA/BcrD ATPase family protein [Salinibius halmophilus]